MNKVIISKVNIKKLEMLASWMFLLLCYGYALFFVAHNYYVLINSDTSSELILGKVLAQEGGILSDNWFYSTELRVFNTNIVYKIVYRFFSNNWFLYRIVSNAILLAGMIASYIYMTSALKLGAHGIWSAGIIVLPFSPVYGYIVDYGAFYVPHLIFTFLSIALVIRFSENSNKKTRLLYIIMLILIGMMNGTGGVRGAMICYVPAFIASLILMFEHIVNESNNDLKNFVSSKEFLMMMANALAVLSFGAGMLINRMVLGGIYHYRDQGGYKLSRFTAENMGFAFECLTKSVGIYEDISFTGPLGITGMAAISLVVLAILGIKRCSAINGGDKSHKFYKMFAISALITNGIILGNQYPGWTAYYWCPVVVLFVPFFAILAKELEGNAIKLITRYLLVIYISLASILLAVASTKYPLEPRIDFLQDATCLLPSRDFILKSGYTQGFATFWQANRFAELCNGKIEMWVTNDANMDKCDDLNYIHPWLQEIDHSQILPEGKFFVMTYRRILDPESIYAVPCPLFQSDSNMIYADDYCTIYGFESMEEYRELVDSLQ